VAVVAPVPYTWTGFYIGGNIGYGWGSGSTSTTGVTVLGPIALTPGNADLRPHGWFSGLQAGYNWQIGPSWLVGLETDFQFSDIKGSTSCLVVCGTALPPLFFTSYSNFSVTDRMNWFGTVRGRVGYVAGPALLYFTGGLAYAEVERVASLTGLNTLLTNTFVGQFDNTTTKVGWTIGGGVEAKLAGVWSAWTVKAEYLYIDLRDFSDPLNEVYVTFPFPGASRTVTSTVRENIFRLGLNYKFGSYYTPVVTK
jgi:outer membrane immunogenic protein